MRNEMALVLWYKCSQLKGLEYVGIAPKGSQRVQSFLEKAAEGLVAGGKWELFPLQLSCYILSCTDRMSTKMHYMIVLSLTIQTRNAFQYSFCIQMLVHVVLFLMRLAWIQPKIQLGYCWERDIRPNTYLII